MNASHANGCMDTAQKVALCCTTLPLGLIFYNKPFYLALQSKQGLRRPGGEEKVQCWFSSSTFFGFEQRSRPCCHLLCTARSSHQPACLGPLCHDSKSVLASKFAQQQLHPIQCKEMSEQFNQWNQGGRFYLHQRSCSPICQQL